MGFELEAVSIRYSPTAPWIIRDLNLDLREGECLGLIGNNGSGKSTLAHALLGVIPFAIPGIVEGKALLNSEDLFSKNLNARLSKLGYSFQDLESQILFGTVSDVLGLNESNTFKPLLDRAIAELHLSPFLNRTPDRLSSGEAQRVAIAMALRRGPVIIIYDEATSALDLNSRRAFGALLHHLTKDGRSVILLGQREEILSPYADQLLTLYDGRLTNEEINFKIIDNTEMLAFWQTAMKRLCQSKSQSPPRLQLEQINFNVKNTGFRFGPIDLTIQPGESIAVLGPNGSGKTTLFLLLMGLLRAQSGAFYIDGQKSKKTSGDLWSKIITMMFQSPLNQILGATINDELRESLALNVLGQELKDAILASFPYLDFDLDPLELSYGQQRMLTLLNTVLSGQPIVLLEEPEQGLDHYSLEFVRTWFRLNKQYRYKTALFSTHDLKLATQCADRCVLLANGKLVGEISTDDPVELENWYLLGTNGGN